jgi:SecD/SecF fusion protein
MHTPRWKLIVYALILFLGVTSALPNLLTPAQLDRLPGWVGDARVTLGLDLKGGSHLALEIDGKALVDERLDALADEAKRLLVQARIPATVTVAAEAVAVAPADPARLAEIRDALRPLLGPAGLSAFGSAQPELGFAEADGVLRLAMTEAGLRSRLDAAMAQSLEIVRRRIDEVGVVEPTVQRVGADRILVQLPGVQDPTRIKELLGSTAKLSLHEVVSIGPARTAGRAGLLTLPGVDRQERYTVERRPILSGERLVDAAASYDQQTGQPVV